MANPISLSQLTLNPQEVTDVREFIKSVVLQTPELNQLHRVMDGVKMKQQLVLVEGLKKTGRKADTDCDRVSSGATSTLVQKYAEPVSIEDFFEICAKEWDSLWKPLYNKIDNYRGRYDIEGTDVAIMIADLVRESIMDSLWRLAWYGDTDVAQSGASAAGVKSSSDVPVYSPVDGFFKQIFAAVSASPSTIGYYKNISSLQSSSTVTAANAYATFMDVYKGAPAVLRASKDAVFYVSDQLGLGLMEYMTSNSINFTLEVTENGWSTFRFMGHKVAMMTSVWDAANADFESDSTSHGAYLQHRLVFTLPNNLVIATLDEEGIENLEVFYEQKERKVAIGFGYTLDAIVLDEKLVAVAF